MKNWKKNVNINTNQDEEDFFDENEVNDKDKRRIILYIVIIVVLLLLLITSCSSGLIGKIGNIFKNEGNYIIDKDHNDLEEVLNQDLKFDSDTFEISETDSNFKLSFSYENINPGSYSCTTSDASVATCFVSDGYVIINPKNKGEVSVLLQTTTNGKIYKATAKLNIVEGNRKISITSSTGTIYLGSSKVKNVTYSLVGLTGVVNVSSSDESVATASANNGVLKITGLKAGSAEITLSLEMNGRTYTATYNVVVKDGTNPNAITNKNPNKGHSSSNKDKDKDKDKDDNKPVNPDKPSENNSVSTIDSIISSKGVFTSIGNNYYLGVGPWTFTTDINVVPTNKNSTITYTYKRADKDNYEIVDIKNDLRLKMGDNILIIKVTSPDKTSTTTYTVTINRAYSSKDYLKDISINGVTINGFDKNKLSYEVDLDNKASIINFKATPWSNKASVKYVFNGTEVKDINSLNKLQLLTGPNSMKIYVTDKENNTRVYSVMLNRVRGQEELDTNSYLKDLVIKNSEDLLIPFDFNSHIFNYNIAVTNNVNSINIDAIPSSNSNDVVVKYKFNGEEHITKNIKDINLEVGNNEVKVIVSLNGSVKTYTLNINRATVNNSTSLKDLTVEGFNIEPEFASDTLEYSLTVPNNTNNVLVKGTSNGNGTVTYNGSLDGTIPLIDGYNKVLVKVSDGDKDRTYTINIYKESPTVSSDTSIKSVIATVNGRDKDITDTFMLEVDNDIDNVLLNVKPNDTNATVTYNGNANGLINLEVGVNKVIVSVKASDGTIRDYEVTITRKKPTINPENPTIEEIVINNISRNIASGSTTVVIDRLDPVKIDPINDENVDIIYTYNGKTYTTTTDLNSDINKTIHNGNNIVLVTVSSKEDSSKFNTYTVNLIKDNNYVDIDVTDYTLDASDATGLNYNLNISYNEDNLELKINPKDKDYTNITYILNDEEINLSDLNSKLTDYNNTLEIKVDSKDFEISRTYKVIINKPTRKLEITNDIEECYLDNENVCIIDFVIKETKDGENFYIVSEDIENINISSDNDKLSLEKIDFNDDGVGSVKLNPNKDMAIGDVIVTLTYNNLDLEKTISFKVHDNYELYTKLNSYTIPTTGKDIILYSINKPIFTGEVVSEFTNNQLVIMDKEDSSTRIVVTVKEGDVTIAYNPSSSEIGPTSLPIRITASNPGNALIYVEGFVKGSPVNSGFYINLTITQKYIVNLYANGGYFDINNKDKEDSLIRSFTVDNGDTLKLMDYEPFKSADTTNCKYFEFLGYSENKDNTVAEYTSDLTITKNLDLYAIYSTKTVNSEDKEFSTIWIDPEIFKNKDTNNNLIYPGAVGYYRLNFTNKTGSDIKITGLTLKEDTVCIENMGCLNMGYIIKYHDGTNYNYYVGNNIGHSEDDAVYKNDNYYILNSETKTKRNTKKFDLSSDNIIIPYTTEPTSGITLELSWKWIDTDNALDTEIGKKANLSNEENVTDKYQFSLAIHYKNVSNCPLG